jgi:hypothetical protein
MIHFFHGLLLRFLLLLFMLFIEHMLNALFCNIFSSFFVHFFFNFFSILFIFFFFLLERLRTPLVMSKVGWLYSRYNIGVEWWDLHEIIRKLLLCGVLLCFPNPTLQLPIAIILCIFSLVNLNMHRPHKSKIVFKVAELASCAITVKYVGGLQLRAMINAPKGLREIVGWWLIAVDIFVFLSAIVASIMLVWKLLQQAKKSGDMDDNLEESMTKIVPSSRVQTKNMKDEAKSDKGIPDLRTWDA